MQNPFSTCCAYFYAVLRFVVNRFSQFLNGVKRERSQVKSVDAKYCNSYSDKDVISFVDVDGTAL